MLNYQGYFLIAKMLMYNDKAYKYDESIKLYLFITVAFRLCGVLFRPKWPFLILLFSNRLICTLRGADAAVDIW